MGKSIRKCLTIGFTTLALAGGLFATQAAHAAYYCTWTAAHGHVCQ